MTLGEILSSVSLSNEWFEKLERAKMKERGRRHLYVKHYADKMSYERFIYCQALESDILWGRSCDEKAIYLLNKYDEDHPTERFN